MTAFEGIAVASAALVMVTGGTAAVVVQQTVGDLPRPDRAITAPPPEQAALSAPASFSDPELDRGRPLTASRTVAHQDAHAIPDVARAAYHRAASVMGASDAACGLDWTLLAAIGSVESDHGRFGGNRLGRSGLSRPGIFGPALDGAEGKTLIEDTDAGELDGDPTYDRAVGAMQFIPATWALVGLDADGDGRRDPQDIDDSALAAGVYLCYGDEDLATARGAAAAVRRYNHSDAYVALVLDLMRAYQAGEVTPLSRGVSAGRAVARPTGPTPATPASSKGSTPPEPRAEQPPAKNEREPEPAPRPTRSPAPAPEPEDPTGQVEKYVADVEETASSTPEDTTDCDHPQPKVCVSTP